MFISRISRNGQRTRLPQSSNSSRAAAPAAARNQAQQTAKNEAPRMVTRPVRTVLQSVENVLYGTSPCPPSSADAHREAFRTQHDVLTLQQQLFDDLLDRSPALRHQREWDKDAAVIRYDKAPASRTSSWIRPDRKDPAVLWLEGGIKSSLNDAGQMVPAGGLSASEWAQLWDETAPVTLANLAYQHVMSTNKTGFKERVPDQASTEQIAALSEKKIQALENTTSSGSPLTSFTMKPPMESMLEAWGAAGKCIALHEQTADLVGPWRLAWMIREFANVPGIDEATDFAWRKHAGCFVDPDCDATRKMERMLTELGIDPDGCWTKREKAVFYVLVADEHLLIGVPPAGSATVAETRKQN